MKFITVVAGFALALSPVTAMAKPYNAALQATHSAKIKTTCKGEFMYPKGGKCLDARDKPSPSP